MKSEDLHAGDRDGLENMVGGDLDDTNLSRFDLMEEGREIWLQRQHDLLDGNDASMFYGDFPPLPDFPCTSSSSSSSSTPAPVKALACSSSSSSPSSSSAASWAVLKSDAEEDVEKKHHHHHHHYHQVEAQPTAALSSTASMEILQRSDHGGIEDVTCMDVMDNFGCMDLLEPNDIWDPSSIFYHENHIEKYFPQQEEKPQAIQRQEQEQEDDERLMSQSNNEEEGAQEERSSEDIAMVFFEWLKLNKEAISAEDLGNIKLKRSTIECAAKRLGGGKEGMKQLLKLILEWVQNTQLQKKRMREASASHFPYQCQDPFQNPNPNTNPNYLPPDANPNPCFSPSPWTQPSPYVTDPAATVMAPPPPVFPPMVSYMGDPFSNGTSASPLNQNMNVHPYPPSTEYHVLDSAHTWPPSQFALATHYTTFPDNNLAPAQHPQVFLAGFGNQYPYQYFPGQGEKLVRLGSSATKEARKKRMARQRRFLSHHHRHQNQNQHNQQNQHQNQTGDQHARLGSDNCTTAAAQPNPGNWVFWSSPAASTLPVVPADAPQPHVADRRAMQGQNYQRQISSDRRQGWKPEKNLRFLLQKVLKQSDVGNLGRIVLPKKEAETHLPELEARDGISIAMEDIGTSQVWNMRYRFWPNNKSRMYLLENTGDFVRSNGLQEGDFIVIYSDVKCGKYMIRGVKVRQPGSKSEARRSGKGQRNLQHATSQAGYNGSSYSPITQTVK